MTPEARVRGRVKFFNAAKGWGFLLNPYEGGADLFVHHEHIRMPGYRTLEEAQLVEFVVVETPKGPAARAVGPL